MAAVQILVVDDNELQSKLVSFLLKEAGYAVQTAASAEQAMDLLKSFQPQLILVDLQLPGMDGLELTRRVRFKPAYRNTIIVALTAYTDPSDLDRAGQAGCDGHISKPIDASAFGDLVRKFAIGIHPEVPGDGHDLLAEIRNTFLTEGLEQCAAISKDLESRPGHVVEVIRRVIHRWADLGATLGFPQISDHARGLERLLAQNCPQEAELRRAIELAQHRFSIAAHFKPKLPSALITGLAGARIGLVGFSGDEANRIRNAAERSEISAVLDRIDGDGRETQIEYDVLIVNECSRSGRDLFPAKWPVPAVFIGSRSSLESISELPSHAFDFLIAPWDAEEVWMRVFRLIAKPAVSQDKADLPERRARPVRVLIADDDPDIVALASEVLRQFEMECDVAHSGTQALNAIRRRLPDAVVLDINMFDLDGFEVLRRIRRNLLTKDLPVLLLTGRNQEADVSQGFSDGANDYMIKPFQPLELANRVAHMISARGNSRARIPRIQFPLIRSKRILKFGCHSSITQAPVSQWPVPFAPPPVQCASIAFCAGTFRFTAGAGPRLDLRL